MVQNLDNEHNVTHHQDANWETRLQAAQDRVNNIMHRVETIKAENEEPQIAKCIKHTKHNIEALKRNTKELKIKNESSYIISIMNKIENLIEHLLSFINDYFK